MLQEEENKPEAAEYATTEEALYVYKNYDLEQNERRKQYREQQRMPDWAVKEEFVISGMSGRFPESDNVREFEHNLYENIDMVVEDERRWPFGYMGLPKGSGKLRDISLFDNRFFNVNKPDAHLMDSQVRIMLEITFEALWDAGLDPGSLAGSKTGVFLGNSFDEYMDAYAKDHIEIPAYRQCFYAMLANVYDFRGPSKHFETACASGFSAFHEAMVSVRSGQCERAIVVGLNLSLRAVTQNLFLQLNMISPDGHCKCLDDDANGYAKGEACVAIVLQRKSEAKRIYATVLHTKTNCDGFKNLGITFPSFELQRELIEDTYSEAKIDPLEVGFCEAHCTGTQAGDPSEMRAIYEAMCKDRKEPLLIGAIKSVIGHTEASSGLCALVKSLLCFENEMIPANLHMQKINHRIESLVSGILKPVISNTPYIGKYIALNCFGFGGVNIHAIIRKHESKQKSEEQAPDTSLTLPRLVTFCGRNPETLKEIYQFIKQNPNKMTSVFLSLLNDVSKTSPYPNRMIKGMRHRAYVLLDKCDQQTVLAPISELKSGKIKDKIKPPICFVFTGMGCQWTAMGEKLSQFEVVKSSLEACNTQLRKIEPKFDLMHILTDPSDETLKTPLNSFVTIAAIQIALIDLLRHLNIVPDYIVGHSIGELSCAYADGCLTLDEAISCAYWRGICVENLLEEQEGAMAAIGCSWQDADELCHKLAEDRVWPACHNGVDSVTVSSSKIDMETFLQKLHQNNENIFVRKVNSSGIAFHCPRVESIRTKLLPQLKRLLDSPKRKRSSRWLSSTYDLGEADQSFTAEYLVDNLILPVRFHEALQQVPSDSIFLEIGSHHLLQAIVKTNCIGTEPVKYVPTLSRQKDNVLSVLQMIGLLYLNGLNPRSELLYPKVQYPVPPNTASLHSFIHWKHDRHFTVTQYPEFFNHTNVNKMNKGIELQDKQDKYLQDHCIDGRVLFPATGYLYLVWEYMAQLLNVKLEQLPIIFEDISLHRATILPKSEITFFDVYILNGCFTITQGGMVTTTGKVRVPQVDNNDFLKHQSLLDNAHSFKDSEVQMKMKNQDIYKEFRLRGYDYGPEFQAITQIQQVNKTLSAKVVFKNWITFVDGLIQMGVLGLPTRGLFLPVRIDSLRCDPKQLFASGEGAEEERIFDVFFDGEVNIGVAPGIEYQGIKANLAPRKINQTPVVETFEFVANNELNLPYIASQGKSERHNQTITSQINAYHNTCMQMLSSKLDEDQLNQFVSKHESEVSTAVLMKFLSKITDWSTVDEKMLEPLEDDLLFRTYETERFLRAQLETFCENIFTLNLQVLEIGQTPGTMSKNIHSWLLLSSLKVTFTYRLLHSGLDQFKSMSFDSIHSQHNWIAEKNKFPTDLANLDLIVYKDSSTYPLLAKHKIHFPSLLESMSNALAEKGFCLIILRDRPFKIERKLVQLLNRNLICDDVSRVSEFEEALANSSFSLVGHKSDVFGVHAFFIRKIVQNNQIEKQHFLTITNDVKQWFEPLKAKLAELATNENTKESENTGNVWLLANEAATGVIGLISCLRKEPHGSRVRCILNCTEKASIDLNSSEIANIIKLDMLTNVLGPNGMLGSYRHFTLHAQINESLPKEHCFLNVTTRGNLSSLRWFESSHKYWPQNQKPGQTLCTVYYAALNFRDIMLATGKLPPDALPDDMGLDDCLLGLEFSGCDENGNRVMGMVPAKGLATTIVMPNSKFLWPIPAHWSMEEASTVPVAYATAYYALLIRGKLQRHEKVLIHSGSGAVGQAAIAVCLSYDCQLFITVGSDAKRDILMRLFPQLKATQFASSRNIDFAKQILQATNGVGVDLILNSLSEEKLQASVSCLAKFGRFLEIGKFDLSQNNKLDTSLVMNKTFHGILLDNLLNFGPNVPNIINQHRGLLWEIMKEGIEKGVVRPLERTIFTVDQCEDAFRYMASGKHVGKVVICIQEEEKNLNVSESSDMTKTKLKIPAIPTTVFWPDKSYIITGGLGGFGLELINWMFERDARRFVLTSRTGAKDLYQETRLNILKQQGGSVTIFTGDASQEEIAQELVNKAEEMGPLGGVFHLAMVLSDGLFENQTSESFETVVKTKATTFAHLDKITRAKCPHIEYFVAFSSVSCGMGNPGQSNYGFANSVMERICEQRRRDSMHGFAIQWGPIGDAGYIINNIRGNDVVICDALPQRMPSCLATLDQLLQTPYSVCSSLIRMDCKSKMTYGKTSLIQAVAHILGIKEYDKLDKATTLSELGMDSLMGVEIKQTIERDYDVVLTANDIRNLTICKIIEIGSGQTKENLNEKNTSNLETGKTIDEQLIPLDPVRYLNDIVNGDPIFFLPQIDATYEQILPIAAKLNRPAIGLNWNKDCAELTTVPMVATHYIQLIEQTFPNLRSNYDLVGYSFGGIIAIEMGIQLHKRKSIDQLGPYRKLIILDSSPNQFKIYTDEVLQKYKVHDKYSDQVFVATILTFLMTKLSIDLDEINKTLLALDSNTKRIEFVRDLYKQKQGVDIQSETLQFLIETNYNKLLMMNFYECVNKSLPGNLMLIRASDTLINDKDINVREDYLLGEIVTGQCETHVLKGDHRTFITNNYPEINEIIRKYLDQ